MKLDDFVKNEKIEEKNQNFASFLNEESKKEEKNDIFEESINESKEKIEKSKISMMKEFKKDKREMPENNSIVNQNKNLISQKENKEIKISKNIEREEIDPNKNIQKEDKNTDIESKIEIEAKSLNKEPKKEINKEDSNIEELFKKSETDELFKEKWIQIYKKALSTPKNKVNYVIEKCIKGRFTIRDGKTELLPDLDISGKSSKDLLSQPWNIK